jgi:Asp-tRNA(Asn)/Glu-tRNA(Gln) amidotransferase A subunit family amidase
MARGSWMTLSYRIPPVPTRLRLAAWRRLKRIGAVLLHDSVWVLPTDGKTREAFEWLAEEIEEQGGTALIWEAQSLDPQQDQLIIDRFRAEADARYASMAESARKLRRLVIRRRAPPALLQQVQRQLLGLERALRLERRRDYFRAPGRSAAEEAIRQATADLDRQLLPSATSKEGSIHALGH